PATINATSYAVTGTAEVNSLVKVYIGGSLKGSDTATGGTFSVNVAGLAQGSNLVEATAADIYGQISATSSSTIFVDSLAPDAPTLNSVPATINTTSYAVAGTAETDSVVRIYIGGAFSASADATGGNFSITVNSLAQGSNLVEATAADTYGQISATSSSTIFVDSLPPATPTYSNLPASINSTSYTVTGTAETGTTVKVYLGGTLKGSDTVAGGTFSVNITGLAQGSNIINATATDNLGNISATASSTIFVDSTPPATPIITTNGGADFTTQNPSVTIEGICSADTQTILVNSSFTNVTYTPGNTNWSFLANSMSVGPNTFNVVAVDAYNNYSGTDSINVSYDSNVPADPAINAVDTPTSSKTQLITGAKATDATTINVTCITATVGSVSYPTTTTWRVTLTAMSEGNNNITVNAQNINGYSNDVTTVIFVDSIAPNPPVLTSLPVTTSSTSFTVTGTAEVNTTVKIYVGGSLKNTGNATGGNFSISVTGLVQGPNNVDAVVEDIVGNLSTTSSSTIYVLTTPNIGITANVSVQAPATYIGAGGGATDAVPGATLTYVFDYYNYDSVTVNAVEITDDIPTNSAYASALGGAAILWDYGSGWSATTPAVPVDNNVQKVKWTIGSVPPTSGGSVTLNVVIK
ncbi:Ig-like domain-containing protein, partial [Candidatus Margulisiibacteriota bacterium]